MLSEVYYPPGWNAFIDGKKADYVKTNYVLRGMYVPAGDHQIEFRFEPKSYTTGRTITIIANIIVFPANDCCYCFLYAKEEQAGPTSFIALYKSRAGY